MKREFTVFIGYDSEQPEAARACWKSLVSNDKENKLSIQLIDKSTLIDNNLYWRERMETESTEFSFTRFLAPYLKGFYGYALFCDSDFIWNCSPLEVLEIAKKDPSKAVWVVKHALGQEQLESTKMSGKIQTAYPRKNWSSMMLFNCEHPEVRSLTPDVVSEQLPSYLHGLQWASDENIGEVPIDYNFLVGYYDSKGIVPKVLHFTNGTPLHEGYEDCEFAEEFLKYVQPKTK
jgi:hypothetical protein